MFEVARSSDNWIFLRPFVLFLRIMYSVDLRSILNCWEIAHFGYGGLYLIQLTAQIVYIRRLQGRCSSDVFSRYIKMIKLSDRCSCVLSFTAFSFDQAQILSFFVRRPQPGFFPWTLLGIFVAKSLFLKKLFWSSRKPKAKVATVSHAAAYTL